MIIVIMGVDCVPYQLVWRRELLQVSSDVDAFLWLSS